VKSEKLKAKRLGVLSTARRCARSVLYFSFFTFSFSLFTAVSAQDDDDAPPPLKIVTKEERAKLGGESDLKVRTKLAVEMMKLRIDEAERLNGTENFDGMFRELGHFRGLLDYTLGFLAQQDAKQNKTLDNYKRLELFLRAAAPRLETIRRDLPLRYEDYVRELLIYIRDARRKAIEPLFSDTVLPKGDKSEK